MLLLQGVSHCFQKDEEGKLEEVEIIEPINATTLECMNIGIAFKIKSMSTTS